jgi:uncharacterized membrane protein (UPF0127 family)
MAGKPQNSKDIAMLKMRQSPNFKISDHHGYRVLAGFLIFAAFVFVVFFYFKQISSRVVNQTVDLTNLRLEIADTDATRRHGLSGRKDLAFNEGMLFVFDESSIQPFWMKDMLFPLDIIWINQGKVVEVATLKAPSSQAVIPPTHVPTHKADRVLELNSGQASALGIRQGTLVILP